MSRIEIYTTNHCSYCRAAKSLLERKGFEYSEINLDRNLEKKFKLMSEYNWRTVPIILIDGNLVGGYHQLAELVKKNKLDQILN